MRIDRNITKTIDETRYLATENTWRYRVIIRFMYSKYERMKYEFHKEELYEEMKKYEEFQEYTLDNIKNDLDSLVNWGNLLARADTTKVNTIEEFKNREFRYLLTPYTIEIERMIIGLEHMTVENTATLESALVEKFRGLLEKLHNVSNLSNKEVYDWWKELNLSFKELNRNYQDYISQFYSPKNEELMKSTEFLIFKEGFIKYLRQFIRSLQINTFAIKEVLKDIDEKAINDIVIKAFYYEESIKSMDIDLKQQEYMDLNIGRFESMCEWFIGVNGREPLVEQLINNTNEVIRKITRYAAQIADKKNNNANRKEEYRKIAEKFSKCQEIKEAHKLAAKVFGAFNMLHIVVNEERETESINSSIYDETPTEVQTRPKVRTFREKIIKNPIIDKSEKKEEKRKLILEERKANAENIKQFIKDKTIDFEELPCITQKDRTMLLKILTKGRKKNVSWIKGEGGLEYRVELKSEATIEVKCEDGRFKMPHYIISFRDEV